MRGAAACRVVDEPFTTPPRAREHPFDRVVGALQEHRCHVHFRGPDHVRARCPSHADTKPSLDVTRLPDKVLLHDHGGCQKGAVLRALGLQLSDLFSGAPATRSRAAIVATYPYTDAEGVLIAEHVRTATKKFPWRRPDPAARGGWRWGLDNGRRPGLYRWPGLRGAHQVLVVEGEKAVDRLHREGLAATCGSGGAGTWKSTADLLGTVASDALIVILPDNDSPGEHHAERVAADLVQHRHDGRLVVKVVPLPGLGNGADVYDWLEAGHTRDELLALVASTGPWAAGDRDRLRREHRLERQRTRMQELRAARRKQDRRHVDRDGTLAAVVAVLEPGEPRSWRRLWKAVQAAGYRRRAFQRALDTGLKANILAVDAGGPRRAHLYRLAEHPPVTQSGTLTAECPSVPAVERPDSPTISKKTPTVPDLVRRCACAPGVRTPSTLQGPSNRGSDRTCVARSGTVRRPTPVTEGGTAARGGSADPSSAGARLPEAHQQDVDRGVCCGQDGSQVRCKLCRWSATYYRRGEGEAREA